MKEGRKAEPLSIMAARKRSELSQFFLTKPTVSLPRHGQEGDGGGARTLPAYGHFGWIATEESDVAVGHC